MSNDMNDTKSMAVYCDFENVALGVREARYQQFDISKVLERLLLKGSIVVKKAYCDWERYRDFKKTMHQASFELIEIPHVSMSGKNSADIRMVVDALDLCYTKSHVDTFVIISGDSDFSPLVSKLRENNKTVIGVGVKNSTSDLLIANCDEFIYYDDLVRDQQGGASERRRPSQRGTARVQERSPERSTERSPERTGARGARTSGRATPQAAEPGARRAAGAPERGERVRGPEEGALASQERLAGAGPAGMADVPVVGADLAVAGAGQPVVLMADVASDELKSTPVATQEPAVAGARRRAPRRGSRAAAAALAVDEAARAASDVDSQPATEPSREPAFESAAEPVAEPVAEPAAQATKAAGPVARGRGRRRKADVNEPAVLAAESVAAPEVTGSAGNAAATRPAVRAKFEPSFAETADETSDGVTDSAVNDAANDASGSAADAAAPASASPAAKPASRRRRSTRAAAGNEPMPVSAPEEEAPRIAQPELPVESDDVAQARADDAEEQRVEHALDLVVDTLEALAEERGADERIWGSMVKQTLKRRKPGFNEAYYGFRSFNRLLEEARDRGLIELELDDKSGGYVVRSLA